MNQLPERLFVGTEGVDGIETRQPKPAKRAAPLFVEREVIQKRCFAIDAEIIGRDCSGLAHTTAANRDAGNFAEGLAANAAIVRKDQLKKAAKRLFCEGQNGAAEIGQQDT